MRGYSLIEVLLVLALIAVMAAMAAIASRALYQQNHSQIIVDRLLSAIRFARMQALINNTYITFCGSQNQLYCDGHWQLGQIVLNNNHQVLRVLPKLFNDVRLTWYSSGTQPGLTFQPTGFTNGQQGSFIVCTAGRPELNRAVIINHSGRVRVTNKRADGSAILCLEN